MNRRFGESANLRDPVGETDEQEGEVIAIRDVEEFAYGGLADSAIAMEREQAERSGVAVGKGTHLRGVDFQKGVFEAAAQHVVDCEKFGGGGIGERRVHRVGSSLGDGGTVVI